MLEGARILILEDDDAIRGIFVRSLADDGACIMEADTVKKGLAHLNSGPIDLLITDLQLPDGSGIKVAKAYAKKHPTQKILIVTGVASTSSGSGLLKKLPHCEVLQKPVELKEFKSTIRRLLSK